MKYEQCNDCAYVCHNGDCSLAFNGKPCVKDEALLTYVKPVVKIETTALDTQVGGDHYSKMAIQPVEYIHRNGIGFIEGAVIKYISRWRNKNGLEDLKKARHMIDLLIEMETRAK